MGKKRIKREERERRNADQKLGDYLELKAKCPCCNEQFNFRDMTNEHIVPISKGGTNEKDNLTLLCRDCNREKGDLIVHEDWYQYAPKNIKKTIKSTLDKYVHEYAWLTPHSFMPYDIMPIDYNMMIPNGHGSVKRRAWIKKATYGKYDLDDFNKIYEFAEYYNTKHDIDCHGEDLKDCIRERFKNGTMYYSQSKNGDIGCLISVNFMQDLVNNKQHYVLNFENPMCRFDDYSFGSFAFAITRQIINRTITDMQKNGLKMLPAQIELFDADNTKVGRYFDIQLGRQMICYQSTGDSRFCQYYSIMNGVTDSKGQSMAVTDLDLISPMELDKTDKYIQRLFYNEQQLNMINQVDETIEPDVEGDTPRKVKSKKKSRDMDVDKIFKKGNRLKKINRFNDDFDLNDF